MHKYDLIVIGGGASGIMAAGRAAERGKSVLILEKNNSLGEKLKISGGGRCNITNAEYDEHILLKKYGKAEPFLYSPFSQFGVKDTFSFFEKRGLPLIVQEDKRAFPKTEKAIDVVKVLDKYLKDGGVKVVNNSPVSQIISINNKIMSVRCGDREYFSENFLLATGGLSRPETGSTGDGFKWLKDLGHSVSDPTPNIVPLAVSDKWVKALAGTSLSNAKITFYVNSNKSFILKGRILFTHFGISGPLILNSASRVSGLLHEGVVDAKIDAYPLEDLGSLEKRILSIFDSNKNKDLDNIVKDFVPVGMADGLSLVFEKGVDLKKKVHSITKEERKFIVQILKALPLRVEGLMGFDRAVVSDGGVSLEEVDLKTMRSKIIPNLLITGDLLNISRPSGGYSFQLCWTTGHIAGNSI